MLAIAGCSVANKYLPVRLSKLVERGSRGTRGGGRVSSAVLKEVGVVLLGMRESRLLPVHFRTFQVGTSVASFPHPAGTSVG